VLALFRVQECDEILADGYRQVAPKFLIARLD